MIRRILAPLRPYVRGIRFGAFPARDRVIFIGRGSMHVDRAEKRAQSVLRSGGVTQSLISAMFERLNTALRPNIVLDIGSNYGEVSFNCRFGGGQKVFLFEANPKLRPYLLKSIESRRRDAKCFQVVSKAVTDHVGSITFSIDTQWSGTSRIAGAENEKVPGRDSPSNFQEVVVEATAVDDEIGEVPNSSTVLCKIDVEGHELSVLRGMKTLLKKVSGVAMIVEFSKSQPEAWRSELFNALKAIGEIYCLEKRGRVVLVTSQQEITSRDVLVVSGSFQQFARQMEAVG